MKKVIARHILRYILLILIIVVMVKIFQFSQDDGIESSSKSTMVTRFFLSFEQGFNELEDYKQIMAIAELEPYVRKAAHFAIYMTLGFLLAAYNLTFKKHKGLFRKFSYSILISILYSIFDEVHQLFVDGRSGSFDDVLLDSSGALLGILFILSIAGIIRNVKEIFDERKLKTGKKDKKVKDKKKTVLFIASTGGHLSELLQLKDLFKEYNYYLVTEKTKLDEGYKKKYKDKISFLIYGTKLHPEVYPFKLIANSFISLYLYFKVKPDVIVTTGTHTAGPMMCIGKLLGSKTIYIETFANRTSGTVTGKILYHVADVFVVQWEEALKVYPKAKCWGWLY